jgi:hypothetical protein
MGLHQIKKLLHIKGSNNQNQETTHRMGENLCQYSTNKRLISIIYTELKKFNSKRTNDPTNKCANELNRQFSEVQLANKY